MENYYSSSPSLYLQSQALLLDKKDKVNGLPAFGVCLEELVLLGGYCRRRLVKSLIKEKGTKVHRQQLLRR